MSVWAFISNGLVFLRPASQGHRGLCDGEGCEGTSSSGQLPGQRHQQQRERGHRAPQAVGPPQEHVAAPRTHPLRVRREVPVRERGGGGGIEVLNPPKPQTCKNPQGLGSIFNSGKSSTATPASSQLLVSLIISSSPPPTLLRFTDHPVLSVGASHWQSQTLHGGVEHNSTCALLSIYPWEPTAERMWIWGVGGVGGWRGRKYRHMVVESRDWVEILKKGFFFFLEDFV